MVLGMWLNSLSGSLEHCRTWLKRSRLWLQFGGTWRRAESWSTPSNAPPLSSPSTTSLSTSIPLCTPTQPPPASSVSAAAPHKANGCPTETLLLHFRSPSRVEFELFHCKCATSTPRVLGYNRTEEHFKVLMGSVLHARSDYNINYRDWFFIDPSRPHLVHATS